MQPTLPQKDPNPAARAASRAEQARAYAYTLDEHGVPYPKELPPGERYDARYLASAAGEGAALLENRARIDTRAWPEQKERKLPEVAKLFDPVGRRVDAATNHLPGARPTDPVGYDDLHASVGQPVSFGRNNDDAFFAWRQLAGATPILLRALDRVPENVPLDAATFARAVGASERLDAAVSEGRLFACDYAALEGLVGGQSEGMQKYVYAPVALFLRGASGALQPVAIQTTQRPSASSPLWTPADGLAWRMAKAVVNNSEMIFNGVVAHFSLCHLVAQGVVCVSRATLAPTHPLMHLLAPHFEYTLAVNDTARTSIVNPGGKQEFLLGGTLASNFDLVARINAATRYDSVGAREELRARGLDSTERLPVYPYRDDGVPLADALHRWVEAYLRVYYTEDSAVRGDPELAAWAAGLAGDGGLRGMPALDSVASLSRFLGDLLWRLTGYHSVVNYGGWDFASWAPDMPSALFAEGPRAGATEADWRAMLPPLSVANGMLEQMHSLHGVHLNTLGGYPEGHFADPQVLAALASFRSELESLEAATKARDAQRPWSFPYLHPSRVPNSIHV